MQGVRSASLGVHEVKNNTFSVMSKKSKRAQSAWGISLESQVAKRKRVFLIRTPFPHLTKLDDNGLAPLY